MRHRVSGRKLDRPTAHRMMMYRNLVTDLIRYEHVVTTEAKGKEIRGFTERMISLGKVGGLHSYRQALSFVIDKNMVEKIFTELVTRYAQRPGGYTRITRLLNRLGDNAPMAKIELLK